jgi:DNA-directed RNA polymerase specialized sigma24 family protein
MGTYTNQSSAIHDPDRASDRRRKVEQGLSELILSRAECLPRGDRELLRTLFAEGRSATDLAPMLGCPARALRSRGRRLAKRLLSDFFVFVLQQRASWPEPRRKIATAVALHGLSLRDASAELRLSIYTVRRQHDAVLALYAATGRTDQRALQAAG